MKTQAVSSKLSPAQRKRLRLLLTKKGRAELGEFIGEGIRLLEESIHLGRLPLRVYYAEAKVADRGRSLLHDFKKAGVVIRAISALEMKQLSDTETSQGMIGIFKKPEFTSAELYKDNSRRIMLLDNISDPGNAGTLVRSALAFGFDLALFSTESVEPFNPKVVRASAGAILGLPIITVSISDIAVLKAKRDLTVILGDLRGERLDTAVEHISPEKAIILVIGSESAGVSNELRELADITVRIDHETRVESLNAAVAGSIIMKELHDRSGKRSQ